jgi:hypothetical protein
MPINGVAMDANITGIAKRMSAAYDGVADFASVMGSSIGSRLFATLSLATIFAYKGVYNRNRFHWNDGFQTAKRIA